MLIQDIAAITKTGIERLEGLALQTVHSAPVAGFIDYRRHS